MKHLILVTILFAFSSAGSQENYRFVVIGDRTGGCVGGIFSEIIDEVVLLDPDFVLCVGDLIHGYTDDTLALHAQWDTLNAIVEKLQCPFHYVAGNHDIINLTDRGIYEQRTGYKRYYSFDHNNTHFIILDNTMTYWSPPQEMDEEQLDWLKKDLKKNRSAENTFVFYHIPSYLYALQRSEEDGLMELFERYGVDMVFTGHHHTYSYLSHNDIEYINVGSSGGGMDDLDMGRGHFYHYLHVSVRGREPSIAVIRKNNILDRNVLTADDLLLVQRADAEVVQIGELIAFEDDKNKTQRLTINVSNFGPYAINETIPWEYDTTLYSILPAEIEMDVGSEEQKSYLASITLKNGAHVFPIPQFKFRFPYSYAQACTVTGYVPIKRAKRVVRTEEVPVIDGDLNEITWQNIDPITELADGYGNPDTLLDRTEIYICHDVDNVYIGARCFESTLEEISASAEEHDGRTPWDDNLWLFFDPNNDETTYYQMIVNSKGVIFDRKCEMVDGESIKDLSWNGAWTAYGSKEEDAWTLEIRIPKRPFLVYSEMEWGFTFRRMQTRMQNAAYWNLPFMHDPRYFGILEFE
jgi:predicted phosphodiesterase